MYTKFPTKLQQLVRLAQNKKALVRKLFVRQYVSVSSLFVVCREFFFFQTIQRKTVNKTICDIVIQILFYSTHKD